MPEGPDLHLASRLVNEVCKGRVFKGQVVKSEVSRNPDIKWDSPCYTISATSRGKEVKVTLTDISVQEGGKNKKKNSNASKFTDIIFHFGMSGRFSFTPIKEMHKHAHLKFFTKDTEDVLSFVDTRRFGKWQQSSKWGPQRGPCILFEYDDFRANIMKNIKNAAFDKSICEVLLDQKFFNGIGNYLRSEILFRANIAPFEKAKTVLAPLLSKNGGKGAKIKKTDILQLCNIVSLEVINLDGGAGYDAGTSSLENSPFYSWLQCYYQPGMKHIGDHRGRTIWFKGPPGPLAPRGKKARHVRSRTNKNDNLKGNAGDERVEKSDKVTRAKVQVQFQNDTDVVPERPKAKGAQQKDARNKRKSRGVRDGDAAKRTRILPPEGVPPLKPGSRPKAVRRSTRSHKS